LFWLAPSLYRLALTGALEFVFPTREWPKGSANEQNRRVLNELEIAIAVFEGKAMAYLPQEEICPISANWTTPTQKDG
jgi:hypothetical protein